MHTLYSALYRLTPLFGSLLLAISLALPAAAQIYTLPTSGNTAISTCSGTLYDDGGANGTYTANANGSTTITPATAGSKVRLTFTSFSLGYYDLLTIYDGSSTSAPVIGTYNSSSNPGTVYGTTSTGTLTVRLASDYYTYGYTGFAASIACVTSVPQADLAIQGASAQPLAIVPGNSMSVNCTIYNLSGNTAQSSSVGYYLSADATLSTNDVLLGNSVGGLLSVNQSSYRSATLAVPAATPTGSYYLLFAADYQNVVSESNEANNVASISVSVVAPSIDLLVQQAYVSTPNTAAGNAIGLSCYIGNQGNAIASSSSVGYYLSTDAVLDSSDPLLTSSFGGQLTPNNTQTRSATTNVPPTTTPGSYYILFAADYQNIVSESNETNNVSSVAITVSAPSVDLVVQQAQLNQTSVAAGAFINGSSYVYNQGNTTASSSSQGVYLSADNTFDANDQLLTSNPVSALSSTTGSYLYPQFMVPTATAAGTYYVLFVADHLNTVAETNETNNVRSALLNVVAPSVDLVMQQAYVSPTSTVAGGTASTSSSIYNQGNSLASSSNVGYYLSTDAVLSANDVLVGNSVGGTLGGGGYSSRYGTVTVPAATAAGSYYVLFVADYLNAVVETNETNNVSSALLNVVAPGVDLVIQQPYVSPASTVAGGTISGYGYLYNIGNTTASSSNVGYYLSSDATLSANDVLLGTSNSSTLSGGNSTSLYSALTVPAATAAGSYYVLFVADHLNTVSETNETNNISTTTLTVVAPGVDFVMQQPGLSGSSTGAGGALNTFSYLYNQGNSSASSSNVGYYLSTDATLSANDVLVGNTPGGTIGGGSSLTRYGNITVPVTTASGTYYVLFVADYLNSVAETNETNNVASVVLTVTAPFAGTIVPYSGTTTITTCATNVYDHGGTGPYNNSANGVLVINPGTAGSKVQLAFSLFAVESCCDRLMVYDGNSTSAPLLGTYTANPGTIRASATNTSGALTLWFSTDGSIVDAGFQAAVSCVTSAATMPDLTILQPVLSSYSVRAGSNVTASATLGNQGVAAAAQSAVGYYLSTDATLSSNDEFLGNSQATVLNAGLAQAVSASLFIPTYISAGNYYILFVADHAAVIPESNETNNVAARSFAVTVVQSSRDEQLVGLTLSVFPNPAATGKHFTVQLDGSRSGETANLTLHDALGRPVVQQQVALTGRQAPVSFDTRNLSTGVYVLRVTGAGLNATRRIVIE